VTLYEAGNAGHQVEIAASWRVLDVGSGQNPHPRADVLLDKFVEDNLHRSGAAVVADERLVVGDALEMPFADRQFDYVIASNIAEHVDDPAGLCRELMRVGRAGFIETPGWLGDMLLREPFHLWRVRARSGGLDFRAVVRARPLGPVADCFYACLYATVEREGHRTLRSVNPLLNRGLWLLRRALARAIRLPGIRPRMYTIVEWSDGFPVWVNGRPIQ
jgi:hypothetical protein